MGNVRRSNIFEVNYMLADVDKPVDKARWGMSPQTVNAITTDNERDLFPAAILQLLSSIRKLTMP